MGGMNQGLLRSSDQSASVAPSGRKIPTESLTRREALGRLISLSATASLMRLGVVGVCVTRPDTPSTVLEPSEAGGFSFFSVEQKATVSALADLIIPADRVSPGAKAAGVADYIGFLVTQASPDDQRAWTDGLRALDQLSQERFGANFSALQMEKQDRLLAELGGEESSPRSPAAKFFVRAKRATAEGFYTSKVGLIEDLKYQGNTYVEAPATCADQFGKGNASADSRKGSPHGAGPGCPRTSGAK